MAATPEERVLRIALRKGHFWCVLTTGFLFRCIYCHPESHPGISLTEWGSGIRLHRGNKTHKALVKNLEREMTKNGPGIGEKREMLRALTDEDKLGDEGMCVSWLGEVMF